MRKMIVMTREETISYILNNKCSITRLGNGEMDIILGDNKHFQKYDAKLAEELKQLKTTNNILLCVPKLLEDKKVLLSQNNGFFAKHRKETLYYWRKYYRKNSLMGDACLTRFYMDFINKSGTKEYVELLSKIWEGRDIVFIEGEYSRLGVGNDLFNSAKSIKRVICPAENAYTFIDEIEAFVCDNISFNYMLILALGPTASVLSYRLSLRGYQAYDLGHVDIEYEWFLRSCSAKTNVDGKYVNELDSGRKPDNSIVDENYENQVIGRIGC